MANIWTILHYADQLPRGLSKGLYIWNDRISKFPGSLSDQERAFIRSVLPRHIEEAGA